MQTRLTDLSVRNAFTFKKLDVNLSDRGLVLVRGDNHDASQESGDSSNGAAKSAIFEVVRHILLGTTARGTKGREIVRAGAAAGYVGSLSLERDDHVYRVQQAIDHVKHGNTTLVFDNETLVTHQRAKVRNQKYVESDILGMSEQQFDATVFISQEAAHPLIGGTGPQCATYLAATFGLEIYDELIERLKDTIKSADKSLGEAAAYEGLLSRAEENLASLGDIEAARKAVDGLTSLREHIDADIDQLVDYLSRERDLLARRRAYDALERDDRSAVEIRDELTAARKKLASIQTAIDTNRAAVQQQERRKSLLRSRQTSEDALKDIDLAAHQKNAKAAQVCIETDTVKLEGFMEAAAPLKRLEGLEGDQLCPTCGQNVDASHLSNELEAARLAAQQVVATKLAIKKAKDDLQAAQQAIDAHRTISRALQGTLDSLAETPEVVVADMADLRKRSEKLQRLVRELETALEGVLMLASYSDVAEIDVEDLQERCAVNEKALERMRADKKSMDDRLMEARQTVREADKLFATVTDLRARLDVVAEDRRRNDLRKILQKALKKLKVRRLHDVVKSIQEALPPYCATMFGDEDVRIEVDDSNPDSIERWCSRPGADGRVRIPIRALSKGERAKLRVAFIWAVRKLMRPERTANILILDEADGGLDRQGLEAYASLLDGLRSEYSSIFVISHRKELSTVQFDSYWTVHKRDGVSTLSME